MKESKVTLKNKLIGDDLAAARRKGQTYNKMFAKQREEDFKKGALSKEAYKAGKAYELYTPKEVRDAYKSDPRYFESRAKEGASKVMKKSETVKSAPSRANGIEKKKKQK